MARRIGIFAGSAGSNSGGPERYETELLRGFHRLGLRDQLDVFCLFRDAPQRIGVTAPNFRYRTLWPAIRPVAMTTSLPAALLRARPDILHATFLPPPISPQPYIFTLVCSSMFEHPEFYPPAIRLRLQVLFNLAVRQARLIICISRHIEETIRRRFNVPPERSCVIPLAASDSFRPLPRVETAEFLERRYGITGPYLLFSGRWEQRKNVARILEAFHRFKQRYDTPHKLVMTGERTWANAEAEAVIRRFELDRHMIDLGKSPVDELPQLYAGADALVYPSLWEGFGLPIVEAMRAGTPVITSTTSCMPEIAGDAALLVDPLSVDEISAAMGRIVHDRALAERLRTAGLRRGAEFSWDMTARQTLAAYERV